MGWIGGTLTAIFLLLTTYAYADDCMANCTGTGWTLWLEDSQLTWPEGALTEEECEDAYREIEPQTPPFSRLVCVETEIAIQEI